MTAADIAHTAEFFIGGRWVAPTGSRTIEVVSPVHERAVATVPLAEQADVDAAVAAARTAFAEFSQSSRETRLELFDAVIAEYQRRADDLAGAITTEIGAPPAFAAAAQVPAGLGHLIVARKALATFEFETTSRSTIVRREPIGVCALITPWNWPLNQITSKLAAAIATGCTVVLKPSELSPLDAIVLAEILDTAGLPPGVFNLINGDGPTTGAALAAHPGVGLVSITGSTAAGAEVARLAAPSVKRVVQELGGKSADIVLDGVDLYDVVTRDVLAACVNAGQSCAAGTRILVPRSLMRLASEIAAKAAQSIAIGTDTDPRAIGPVVSRRQFDRIQGYIQAGIDEGARLVAGGPGRPDGFECGYYVRPTVFADVDNSMTIARDEIFGPVVVLIGYDDVDDAIRIANDSPYGLSGYVSGPDHTAAVDVARRLHTGMVHVNGAPPDIRAPFGGVKQSGNGREWGDAGFAEFLELKSMFGAAQ